MLKKHSTASSRKLLELTIDIKGMMINDSVNFYRKTKKISLLYEVGNVLIRNHGIFNKRRNTFFGGYTVENVEKFWSSCDNREIKKIY